MKLLTFVTRFREGDSTKDKLVILAHNILYLALYPINHLSFVLLKRNIAHPKIIFKKFTVKNSDGLFICRDNVDHDVISESFEAGIRKYFKGVQKGVFVDVGSNIGKYTVMIGNQLNGKGKVISIEPHPQNFEVLQKNIELNNCKNVTSLNIACWNKKNELKLYNHEDQPLLASAVKKSRKYITVKADTLDSILKNLKIGDIDMVKIDVEGAESEVLKGMDLILGNKKPKVIFEAWDDEHLEACKKILETYGYRVEHLDKMYWIGYHK